MDDTTFTHPLHDPERDLRMQEERAEAERRRLQALLDGGDHDGRPFGIGADHAGPFHLLHLDRRGAATLHFVEGGGVVGDGIVYVDRPWADMSMAVLDDFNIRLRDKAQPEGSWPDPGGVVRLHPCFGRELELLMQAASEGPQLAPRMIRIWQRLTGAARQKMWKAWQKVAIDPWEEWAANEAVKALLEVGHAQRRLEASRAALSAYVLDGDMKALDVAFGVTAALSSEDQRLLKRLVPTTYEWFERMRGDDLKTVVQEVHRSEDADFRLARHKQRAEAKAYAAERRARVAQMAKVA